MTRTPDFRTAISDLRDDVVLIADLSLNNVASVANVLNRIRIPQIALPKPPDRLFTCPRAVIVPGVGSFDHGMHALRSRGWDGFLRECSQQGVPILGICLGMQLLCEGSDEGESSGLGLIKGTFRRFVSFSETGAPLKVPHMGWNFVDFEESRAPWIDAPQNPQRFYFVHSYHYSSEDNSDVIGWTTYGIRFASIIQNGKTMGVQFHPEKSHRFGCDFLRNVLTGGLCTGPA